MSEQETIERGARALFERNSIVSPVAKDAAWDGQPEIVRRRYLTISTAALSALRPGDVLPGGNIVVSRSQFAAMAFAKTQADASGKDQGAVNAIVRDTMAAISTPKGGA